MLSHPLDDSFYEREHIYSVHYCHKVGKVGLALIECIVLDYVLVSPLEMFSTTFQSGFYLCSRAEERLIHYHIILNGWEYESKATIWLGYLLGFWWCS